MAAAVPNRGPIINGVSWFVAILSLLFLGLRVYVKTSRHRGLWWDDYMALLSWTAQFVCIVLITINVGKGFGKHMVDIHLTLPEIIHMSLRGAVNGTLLVLAAAWSKTSFALTLLRLTQGWQRWVVLAITISMNAFLSACVIVNYFNCSPPEKTWNPTTPGTCWNENITVAINISSSAYSTLCDLFLALIPWVIVAKLQMKTSEKIGVGVAMSMGVFVAAVGIVKTVRLSQLRNEDFTYNGGDIQIWSVTEISFTIIASSIPILRPFLRDVVSTGGRYITASGERTTKRGEYGRDRTQNTHVTAVHSRAREPDLEMSDNRSDKSIIPNGIVKTEVVRVDYEERSEEGTGFELTDMRRPGHQYGP